MSLPFFIETKLVINIVQWSINRNRYIAVFLDNSATFDLTIKWSAVFGHQLLGGPNIDSLSYL
jgi:hypothetical protein